MKQKKGTEIMLYHSIFSLIILIFILVVFLVWLSTKSSDIKNPLAMAKNLCLQTLTKQRTTIFLETPLLIEKKENGFLVKKIGTEPGIFYSCQGKFEIEKVGDRYRIDVKNE